MNNNHSWYNEPYHMDYHGLNIRSSLQFWNTTFKNEYKRDNKFTAIQKRMIKNLKNYYSKLRISISTFPILVVSFISYSGVPKKKTTIKLTNFTFGLTFILS